MTAGERLRGWIDDTAVAFSGRLGGWIAESFKSGMEKSMDFLEPDLRAGIKPSLLRIRDIPGLPEDLKSTIDKTVEEPKAAWLLAILPYLIGIFIGLGMGAAAPIARAGAYMLDRLIKSARIDPLSVITAWRREPATYNQWFEDLKDLGWSEERIEVLKFATQAYPALADVIRFYAREAFEPDMIDRYGLDEETPPYEGTLFEKLGVPKEIANLYWIAHWEHASYMQVREMLRRGLLSLDKIMPSPPTTKEGWATRDAEGLKAAVQFYRVVEIPTYWRDRLNEIMFEVPTRVDVRRFWDMRTISEEELYSIYHRHGYHGKDLDNYVLWTKVYVAFPDLMARWSKGWITEDNVRAELIGLGMPADRVTEMIQTKVKPTEQEPISDAKKVTQTSIIKWVKEDIEARWEQGVDLLMDLGYDEPGARFTLDAYIAELGSPETYDDWKKITTEYKIATGREAKPMPEEIKTAAAEVVRLTAEVEALELSIKEEERGLIDQEIIPEETTKRLKSLQVKRNRAESKLSAAKSEYDRLVAEWKHGLP